VGDELALAMSALLAIVGAAMIVWGVLHVLAHLIAFLVEWQFGER
jgi:predicted phage tail protein